MIVIDAGHGGKDPGATNNGVREKDIVLNVALKLDKRLKELNQKTLLTRDKDIFIELAERSNIANKSNASIFISLHCNSFKDTIANGVETYHYLNSVEGKKLATNIQDKLIPLFKANRGVKTANFSVLRRTKAPAILAELGFISNVADMNVMLYKQDEIVEALVEGICEYKGISCEEVKDTKSEYFKIDNAHIIKTTPDNIYIQVLGDNLASRGVYGVNGTFFDTSTAPVTSPESCVFIAMNDGKQISNNSQLNGWNAPARATVIYRKDGRMSFRKLQNINSIRSITDWAIGGYQVKPYMDFEREKIPKSINYKTAHTYLGYDKDNNIYLIVKPNHHIREIVPVMDKLKITNAIVLDGGGSSQLYHKEGMYFSNRKINTMVGIKNL